MLKCFRVWDCSGLSVGSLAVRCLVLTLCLAGPGVIVAAYSQQSLELKYVPSSLGEEVGRPCYRPSRVVRGVRY